MFSFAQAFRTVSTSEAKNQLKVPWTFALRVFWSQQTSIFRKEKYRPYHYGAGILLAGATWYIAYDYFTDHIDRSSLLVRQTLFNIKCSDVLTGLLGSGIRIQSRLQGYQSQQKGFADVRFSIVGSSGSFEYFAYVIYL